MAAAGRELSAQQGNGQNGRENAWENKEKMPGRVPGCQKLQSCQRKDTCLTALSDRLIRGKPSQPPRFLLSRQELRSGGSKAGTANEDIREIRVQSSEESECLCGFL